MDQRKKLKQRIHTMIKQDMLNQHNILWISRKLRRERDVYTQTKTGSLFDIAYISDVTVHDINEYLDICEQYNNKNNNKTNSPVLLPSPVSSDLSYSDDEELIEKEKEIENDQYVYDPSILELKELYEQKQNELASLKPEYFNKTTLMSKLRKRAQNYKSNIMKKDDVDDEEECFESESDKSCSESESESESDKSCSESDNEWDNDDEEEEDLSEGEIEKDNEIFLGIEKLKNRQKEITI